MKNILWFLLFVPVLAIADKNKETFEYCQDNPNKAECVHVNEADERFTALENQSGGPFMRVVDANGLRIDKVIINVTGGSDASRVLIDTTAGTTLIGVIREGFLDAGGGYSSPFFYLEPDCQGEPYMAENMGYDEFIHQEIATLISGSELLAFDPSSTFVGAPKSVGVSESCIFSADFPELTLSSPRTVLDLSVFAPPFRLEVVTP